MRALFLGGFSSVTESSTVRDRAALVAALVVTILGSFLALAALGFPLEGVDDANIIFVYARNLVNGAGFVYTPGFERVEGFTSLLWTLVSASIQGISSRRHELLTLAVSLLLTGVTVWSVLRTVFETTRAPLARAAAALWVLAQSSFFAWSFATLMDLTLWSALLALGVRAVLAPGLEVEQRAPRLAGIIALMVLTRPEALLVGPALVALAGFQAFERDVPLGRIARSLALPIVAFVVVAACLTVFRLSYFGYPLPNTYYAKVSGNRAYNLIEGAKYVGRYFKAFPPRLLLLVPLAYGTLDLLRPRAQKVLAASTRGSVFILWLGFVLPLYGGGDHFAEHRFLVPFLPWLALPLAELVANAGTRRPAVAPVVVVLVALVGIGDFARLFQGSRLALEFQLADEGRRMGKALTREIGALAPKVGVTGAGGIAYGYEGRIVDLLGLNYTPMAHHQGERKGRHGHAAFSAEVFWQAPPEVVGPHVFQNEPRSACGIIFPFENQILGNLYQDSRFREQYEAAYFRGQEVPYVGAFFRRDFLKAHSLPGLHRLNWPSPSDPACRL
jgi:arabinofuranosyltransferase